MNREFKDKTVKGQMPLRLDSFYFDKENGCFIEYDGWQFEGKTHKAAFNKVLKYIFTGGPD